MTSRTDMVYEEKQQRAAQRDGVPPQRSVSHIHPLPGAERRGWLTPRLIVLTLAIILLGAAAGLAGALVLPKTYGARAEILYSASQPQQGGDPLQQDRQLSTQLVLLKSRAVLGPIAQKQGRWYEDLDKDVTASILENSNVIQVEAHASTQPAALQMLQAVTNAYLAVAGQPSGVARNLTTQLAETRQNTAQLQTRIPQLVSAVLAGTATQASLDDARAQLAASLDREKALQARIDEINLTGQSGPPAQVLTPPYSLPDPVSPRPPIATGIGALVGAVVAGAMLTIGSRRAHTSAGSGTSS
ncbi:MAG: hypothetical protein JOZ09_12260 [Pseudonocardiales bacterium]|nr:hypothetical protein [Pseudonocardiales bacterium]